MRGGTALTCVLLVLLLVLCWSHPQRRADGFLELRKGVLVVQADGTQKHEVHELEGYVCRTPAALCPLLTSNTNIVDFSHCPGI